MEGEIGGELGISRPVAACLAHVGACPALAEGVMKIWCCCSAFPCGVSPSPALVSAPRVAALSATGDCMLNRFGLLAEACEVELRGYQTGLNASF